MKFILISLFCAGNLFLSNSQTHPGLTFGSNISSLRSDFFESSNRVGYLGGLSFLAIFSEKFQMVSDFYIETSGAKTMGRLYEGDNNFSTVDTETKQYFNRFSFTLVGNYNFLKDKVGVQFGPKLGLVNFGKYSEDIVYYGQPTGIQSAISNYDVNDVMNKVDFGLAFGLSFTFSDFLLAGRYNLGLRSFNNADYIGIEQYEINNSSFQVTLSYFFKQVAIVF